MSWAMPGSLAIAKRRGFAERVTASERNFAQENGPDYPTYSVRDNLQLGTNDTLFA